MRLRETATPLRIECAPRTHVSVSCTVMSVVGESSANDGPVIAAKPDTVMFGMPPSTKPGVSKISGIAEAEGVAQPEVALRLDALAVPRGADLRFVDQVGLIT